MSKITRVEKYKKYREEIENLPTEKSTPKKNESLLKNKKENEIKEENSVPSKDSTISLSYDELIKEHNQYSKNDTLAEDLVKQEKKKRITIYSLIALGVIVIITIFIIVGIKVFGG